MWCRKMMWLDRQCTCNTAARSRNHFCRRKEIRIEYYAYESVSLLQSPSKQIASFLCLTLLSCLARLAVTYFSILSHKRSGPRSVVDIATAYGLDDPGIESRWGRDFPHLSRPALRPTQPPVQRVLGLSPGVSCGRGVMLNPHLLLVRRSKIE